MPKTELFDKIVEWVSEIETHQKNRDLIRFNLLGW